MRAVYTAESVALAVLRVLIHLDSSDVLTAYSLCSAEFDDSLVERLNPVGAPGELMRLPDPGRASAYRRRRGNSRPFGSPA